MVDSKPKAPIAVKLPPFYLQNQSCQTQPDQGEMAGVPIRLVATEGL